MEEQPIRNNYEREEYGGALTAEEMAAFRGRERFEAVGRQPNGLVITRRALIMERAARRIEEAKNHEITESRGE